MWLSSAPVLLEVIVYTATPCQSVAPATAPQATVMVPGPTASVPADHRCPLIGKDFSPIVYLAPSSLTTL